jgi:LPXTG-motif cell wall-anchored protein
MRQRLVALVAATFIATVMGAFAFAAPGNASTAPSSTATQETDCLQPLPEATVSAEKQALNRFVFKAPCRKVDIVDNCNGSVDITMSNTGDESTVVRFRIGNWVSDLIAGGKSVTLTVLADDNQGIEVESRNSPVSKWQTFVKHDWTWNASCLAITSDSTCDKGFKVSVKNTGVADGQFSWQLGLGEPKSVPILAGATLSENFVKGDVVQIRYGKDNNLLKTIEWVDPKNCSATPSASTTPPVLVGSNDLPVTGASLTAWFGSGAALLAAAAGLGVYLRRRRNSVTS